jgi:Big-like domain-containing protein
LLEDPELTAYGGDSSFQASVSTSLSQTILNTSTTTLTSSPSSPTVGQSVTFTATVEPQDGVPPTGVVKFFDGDALIATVALDASGHAVFTTTLAAGSHAITAAYSGDTSFATSTSASLSQSVNLAPSTVTVQPSTTATTAGQPITFTVTITAGTGTPSGTVTFLDGDNALGTATLDANGQASLTLASLSVGRHTITASYSGDATHAPRTAAVADLEITAAPTPNTGQAVVGPTVVALKRYGYHAQPTYLVLSFSGPLDAASAQAPSNYTINEVGRRGHQVGVGSAVYDPSTNTVTPATSQRLDVHQR